MSEYEPRGFYKYISDEIDIDVNYKDDIYVSVMTVANYRENNATTVFRLSNGTTFDVTLEKEGMKTLIEELLTASRKLGWDMSEAVGENK